MLFLSPLFANPYHMRHNLSSDSFPTTIDTKQIQRIVVLSFKKKKRQHLHYGRDCIALAPLHYQSRVTCQNIAGEDFRDFCYLDQALIVRRIRIVWRTSRQSCLLCPWARHLPRCLRLYVADRWWGQAVHPSW